ncbi:uncharacterized protein AMSG_00965 [Thecamonas trahens ATCC 50062]|uniref:WH2 domain-containing protein n=1 Tax=Thecamonas trahens ATCC 50062 TaxID=461836 RepID=A0A0L0DIF0_THETB|nr:hypothetical protein AMSG_00965 [Thecamonas trahens ATCC 50062]KNC52139.1 hypothetical protein AMSG_00965 [Thecamonas trahens ATCC 50062]|eukprot:XP_013762142.1 hypothetical protein AMSG_00965 [Thecamonas trahens ATCC 50062]
MTIVKRHVFSTEHYVRYATTTGGASLLQEISQTHCVGLIHQLSWLAGFAGELFNELFKEAASTFERIQALQTRTSVATELCFRSKEIMVEMSTSSLVSNPAVQTSWKENGVQSWKQQLLLPTSRPPSIVAAFEAASAPPAFDLLDPFTDDQTPGGAMKKYTNPDFFIEQWVKLLMEQREKAIAERKARRKNRKKKKKAGDKEAKVEAKKVKVKEFKNLDIGVKVKEKREKVPYDDHVARPQLVLDEDGREHMQFVMLPPGEYREFAVAEQVAVQEVEVVLENAPTGATSLNVDGALTADATAEEAEAAAALAAEGHASVVKDGGAVSVARRAPTPPADGSAPTRAAPAAGGRSNLLASIQSGAKLKKVDRPEPKSRAAQEPSLLDQIRKGTSLKKASERKLPEPKPSTTSAGGINVAALMAAMNTRRAVIDDDDSDDDDDDWDDDSDDGW